MKMVSAAKLRRAQEQILSMRPYANKILSVIADIAASKQISHPLLVPHPEAKRILLVVITSDRGLCGGFNNNVNRFTQKFIEQNEGNYEQLDVIFIGRKGADYFKRRGVKAVDTLTNLAKDVSYEMAAEMSKRCMEAFLTGGYDEIRFIYNEFKSAISQKLTVETLLPVDISKGNFVSKESRFSKDLIFEPAPEAMIEEFLRQHFAIQVYRCMCESVSAEHAARMTAMENATKNAKEMINSLTLTYNKLRQASITKELIEICSGAEAVNAN
jgi:F-type H+-transporting ATPase subunit gamma